MTISNAAAAKPATDDTANNRLRILNDDSLDTFVALNRRGLLQGLSPVERLLLQHLAHELRFGDGRVVDQTALATALGCSTKTVCRATKTLVARELIQTTAQRFYDREARKWKEPIAYAIGSVVLAELRKIGAAYRHHIARLAKTSGVTTSGVTDRVVPSEGVTDRMSATPPTEGVTDRMSNSQISSCLVSSRSLSEDLIQAFSSSRPPDRDLPAREEEGNFQRPLIENESAKGPHPIAPSAAVKAPEWPATDLEKRRKEHADRMRADVDDVIAHWRNVLVPNGRLETKEVTRIRDLLYGDNIEGGGFTVPQLKGAIDGAKGDSWWADEAELWRRQIKSLFKTPSKIDELAKQGKALAEHARKRTANMNRPAPKPEYGRAAVRKPAIHRILSDDDDDDDDLPHEAPPTPSRCADGSYLVDGVKARCSGDEVRAELARLGIANDVSSAAAERAIVAMLYRKASQAALDGSAASRRTKPAPGLSDGPPQPATAPDGAILAIAS